MKNTQKKKFRVLGALMLSAVLGASAQQVGTMTGSQPRSAVGKHLPGSTTPDRQDRFAQSSLSISVDSSAELLLIDPKGRKLGIDTAKAKGYEDIPFAFYDAGGISDAETGAEEENPSKRIYVPDPLDGSYTLVVQGTHSGTYHAVLTAYDEVGGHSSLEFKNVAIRPDEIQRYQFSYSKAEAAKIRVTKSNAQVR